MRLSPEISLIVLSSRRCLTRGPSRALATPGPTSVSGQRSDRDEHNGSKFNRKGSVSEGRDGAVAPRHTAVSISVQVLACAGSTDLIELLPVVYDRLDPISREIAREELVRALYSLCGRYEGIDPIATCILFEVGCSTDGQWAMGLPIEDLAIKLEARSDRLRRGSVSIRPTVVGVNPMAASETFAAGAETPRNSAARNSANSGLATPNPR